MRGLKNARRNPLICCWWQTKQWMQHAIYCFLLLALSFRKIANMRIFHSERSNQENAYTLVYYAGIRTLLHVQPSLHAIAIDCFWQTHCDEMLISSIELGLAKKLHQLFLNLIFLYLSLFLPCSISVIRCCYESSSWKLHVNVRFLGKRVNMKTQTFQSGNNERQ